MILLILNAIYILIKVGFHLLLHLNNWIINTHKICTFYFSLNVKKSTFVPHAKKPFSERALLPSLEGLKRCEWMTRMPKHHSKFLLSNKLHSTTKTKRSFTISANVLNLGILACIDHYLPQLHGTTL